LDKLAEFSVSDPPETVNPFVKVITLSEIITIQTLPSQEQAVKF
jgi:hypothetical protein